MQRMAEKAVELYEEFVFDLILMDINMPIMDGYRAASIIRGKEVESGKHTPIIAMTAYAMEEDKKMCFEIGIDDYISKPIDIVELSEKIDKWIN